nr:hypothetical protein [Tanacetum cinerariifolium]
MVAAAWCRQWGGEATGGVGVEVEMAAEERAAVHGDGIRHYAKECRSSKRVKDYAYRKEKMLLCKKYDAREVIPAPADDETVPTYDVEPSEK